MSLFEDDRYQWRETYFVLFREADRPSADEVVGALQGLDKRFEVLGTTSDDQDRLEALTVKSPDDASAMDLTLVTGEEVEEQTQELINQLIKATLTAEDRAKMDFLGECDVRFDVYHFEEMSFVEGEDEFLDPGALLLVMERLASICKGVVVDPQSASFL